MCKWATEANVREGDFLRADGGFTCIDEGAVLQVKRGKEGLFVSCSAGEHYIEGQLDDGCEYIGFELVEVPNA